MTQQIERGQEGASPPTAFPRMSYEEFLDYNFGTPHVEWVNGDVILMSPISEEHSNVGGFLYKVISEYAALNDSGGVHYDPFQRKTSPDLPGRAPDILFVAKKNLRRVRKNHLEGPADLVVEIISPGTGAVDRGEKFYEYQQGGVREYWIIDPEDHRADFYRRDRKGVFRPAPAGDDGVYHSAVMKGLWIKVDWLWRRPLPPVLHVLKEWGLV